MASCPRLTDNDDIDIIKDFLRKATPDCRGVSIYNHIHRLLDEIISFLEDDESKGLVISNMNKITQLLQDPEIAELLRSVTYGKYHSDKVVSNFKEKLQEFQASDDTDKIKLDGLTDSDELPPSPRAP